MSQLQKLKTALQTQLDDVNRVCDEESRERTTILGKFRNLEHDIDSMRESVSTAESGEVGMATGVAVVGSVGGCLVVFHLTWSVIFTLMKD